MITIAVDKAEKQLAALVKRARLGEEIVISDSEGAGVKLTAFYRGRGVLNGKAQVSDEDLFEPLPEQKIE